MLSKNITEILKRSRKTGWVLEPYAKKILREEGFKVPSYYLAETAEEAVTFADKQGYPVVAKVVSPRIIHKTDAGGVVVGIPDGKKLKAVFEQFSGMEGFAGVLVEEMVKGAELIVGAKEDQQFGPVILLGIGGVGVEIYKDTSMRMAPLREEDVEAMIGELKAADIINGFRGNEPVNRQELTGLMIEFSELCLRLEEYMESIDLNPVMCTRDDCIIADARIILKK